MFFTRVGRIVAWLAVIHGAFSVALALFVIWSGDPNLAHRYLGSGTTGQAINQGTLVLIFGVVVGVLTDISRSVASATRTQ
ncbi:MAG: hypothetical protein KDA73_13965 [Rhodobacteraceae bacterium]|nr:hypothetical protein [Paracoccaceae bacterium]